MRHVEPIREKLDVNVFFRFLPSDDVPLAFDLLLDGAFSSTSGSWVPAVNAEPSLYMWTVGHVVAEVILLIRCIVLSGGCFAEFSVNLPNVDRVPFQKSSDETSSS